MPRSREGDRHPPPWIRSPEKSQSSQASIQCWAIMGPPAKCHLNGISLVGQWWPDFSGSWILSPVIKENKVGPPPPLTKLSGSAHVLPGHSVWAITLTGWVIDNLCFFRLVKVFIVKVVQLKHTKLKIVFRTSSTTSFMQNDNIFSTKTSSFDVYYG